MHGRNHIYYSMLSMLNLLAKMGNSRIPVNQLRASCGSRCPIRWYQTIQLSGFTVITFLGCGHSAPKIKKIRVDVVYPPDDVYYPDGPRLVIVPP
jgi:hypothetical protein